MRKERRLSQEKLAELCAVHRNYIGRVERAETNIRFDSVIRLSAGLKVRPDKLFKLISRPTIADADAIKKKTSEE